MFLVVDELEITETDHKKSLILLQLLHENKGEKNKGLISHFQRVQYITF